MNNAPTQRLAELEQTATATNDAWYDCEALAIAKAFADVQALWNAQAAAGYCEGVDGAQLGFALLRKRGYSLEYSTQAIEPATLTCATLEVA